MKWSSHAVDVGMLAVLGLLTGCGGDMDRAAVTASLSAPQMARPAATPDARQEAAKQTRAPLTGGQASQPLAPVGTLLDGIPGAYAYSALRSYVDEGAASASPEAPERLRLNAVIARTATIGQVNATLSAVGARIVSMQSGNSEVTLDLALQGGRPSRTDVASQLIATRAFVSVDGMPAATGPALSAPPSPAFDPYAPPPVEDHQSPP